MESQAARETAAWSVPQCPFVIEYAPRVLDVIRLAVVEAFFSLPRGGAEIGGILLGTRSAGKVAISGHLSLDCEHALGPSFTLSARDEEQLRRLLDSVKGKGPVPAVVGWYHSHTRSEIFLSEADLAIHSRYFPEPWQVALVLKPHTFQPMRAGFFFRESGGMIHGAASRKEFVLNPLAPAGGEPPLVPSSVPAVPARAIRPPAGTESEASLPALLLEPQPVSVPRFTPVAEERSWRWMKWLLVAAITLALGLAALETRDRWLTPLTDPRTVGLQALEREGQVQIRWNPATAKVRDASRVLLEILDGGAVPQAVALDAAHVQSGVFTYLRRSERVDVTLFLYQRDGQRIQESTTLLAPASKGTSEDAGRQERDALANQVTKLESELAAEIERNAALQKSLASARAHLNALQSQSGMPPVPVGEPPANRAQPPVR
jgi:proteasome lid subunit RPN8/RPN11